MRGKSFLALFAVMLLLSGCAATTQYRVEKIEPQFAKSVKHAASLTVAQFDAITESEAIERGLSFGLIGVLVANAATASDIETLGIKLQNETLKMLAEETNKANINYKANDALNRTPSEELSKRFKSNRLWGFSDLNDAEVKAFFEKNSDVDFIIHITSYVFTQYSKLVVATKWIIYDKDGSIVARIETKSLTELSEQKMSEEAYLNEMSTLQRKNIKEFLNMLFSQSVGS